MKSEVRNRNNWPQSESNDTVIKALAAVSVAVLASWLPHVAAQTANPAYVHASRINVRASSSPAAAVIAQFTTNTRVSIERRDGDSCDVLVDGLRGVVPCALLGPKPLTETVALAHARNYKLPDDKRLEWAFRAFWVSPSLSGWMRAGEMLEQVEQRASLLPTPPRHAELEAMKQRLVQGLVVRSSAAVNYYSETWGGQPDTVVAAKRKAQLPRVKPSHFDASGAPFAIPLQPFGLQDLLGVAAGLTDALSGLNQAQIRAQFLTGRIRDPRRGLYSGIWDVGTIGVTFDQRAVIHGVTAEGRAVAVRVESLRIIAQDDNCPRSELGRRTVVVRGPWEAVIVAWVGKPAVGISSVKVRRFDGPAPTDKLVIQDIDLNADGVADLSVWSGRFRLLIADDGSEGYWKAVFANVAGKWQLAAYDDEDECT